jgi:hypothetical protein
VVTIAITADAFAAIASTLPKGFKAEGPPDGKGGCLITLDRHVVDRLASMRAPGESYSDVILRLARGRRLSRLARFSCSGLRARRGAAARPMFPARATGPTFP